VSAYSCFIVVKYVDPGAGYMRHNTYIWVKAVRDRSEVILQDSASRSHRAYTGQLATMDRQLYNALPQPQQQMLCAAKDETSVDIIGRKLCCNFWRKS
jgi:hypothetical protein